MRRIIASTGLAFFVALAGAGLTTTAGATARGAAATGAPKQQAAPAAPDITVSPGESIQSAVNHAHPGDVIYVKPGVYHESVAVKKNRLSILGSGASGAGTVLRPPTTPQRRCLHGAAGFCIFGHKTSGGLMHVKHVNVSGFLVRGFEAFGVVTFAANDTMVRHVRASHDGEYGITSFHSHASRFLYNTTDSNGEAGLYFGDSPRADAGIVGNRSFANNIGILLRDSATGHLRDNAAFQNCAGVVIVDTGAPTRPHDYHLKRNQVFHNDRFCKGEKEGPPPLSGTGIAVLGGKDNVLRRNTVWANRPSKAAAAFPGGIVIGSSKALGGSNAAGNHVVRNQAYRNKPADIVWDGKGQGNKFRHNKCSASMPSGLCH
jgi:hypothetical protein